MAKRPLAEIEWVTKLIFQLSEKFIEQITVALIKTMQNQD